MKPKVTPKDFFFWVGAMVAFYWSVIAFIFLFFNYVDYAFPNIVGYRGNPYEGSMPYEMASIIVVFPMFLLLMWLIRSDIAKAREKKDLWVRRWAIILTLFIAGLTAVIDLVTLLTAFFRGEELTTGFLLKVLVVLFVSAVVFMHFIADLWGYWERFPQRNHYVAYGVGALALVSVIAGFFIVGTPWQARMYRLDQSKINDLQSIQSQVLSYWQAKEQLPSDLSDLKDAFSGYAAPVDTQTGEPYVYQKTGDLSFKLCATFNAAGDSDSALIPRSVPVAPGGYAGDQQNDLWTHGAGQVCFARTIDPSRYPPLPKPTK